MKDLKVADLLATCSVRNETELLGHLCSEASLAHRCEGVVPKPFRSRVLLDVRDGSSSVRAAETSLNGAIPRARAGGSGLPVIHGHDSVAGIAPHLVGADASLAHRGEGVLPVIHGHDSVAGFAPLVFGAEARVSSESRHSRTQVG